jgi:hypothetical protein
MELYDALRKAGVDDETARAAARAVIGVEDRAHLATRADLADLKLATRADLAELRADLAELKLATRADLAELKADLIKWNVGAMVALTAIFAAINRLV